MSLWGRSTVRRGAAALVSLGLLTFTLAGCIKVDLTTTIHNDDTVDGSLTAAVQQEAVDVIGRPQAAEFVDALTTDVPGAYREETYDDGEFVGRTIYYRDVPIDEFGAAQTPEADSADLRITHFDGRYILDGAWDLPKLDAGSAVPELDASIVDSSSFTVSVTFPGQVISHNGELSGTTVTWQLKTGENNLMVAESYESGNRQLTLIVLVVSLAVLLLVAVALFIQLRRHSLGTGPH